MSDLNSLQMTLPQLPVSAAAINGLPRTPRSRPSSFILPPPIPITNVDQTPNILNQMMNPQPSPYKERQSMQSSPSQVSPMTSLPIPLGSQPSPSIPRLSTPFALPVISPVNSEGIMNSELSPVGNSEAIIMEAEREEKKGEGTIDEILKDLGYTPTNKMMVSDENGTAARFLGVVTPKGHEALVDLDTDGKISLNQNDVQLHEGPIRTQIPYSLKVGALESAGNGVEGVAIVCSEGICTMQKESNLPKETTFVYISEIPKRYGKITTHPIVRMSELTANPEMVEKNIETASSRLRRTTEVGCRNHLKSLDEAVNELTESLHSFKEAETTASNALKNSIVKLETFHQSYHQIKTVTPDDVIRHEEIKHQLYKRHELALDLLFACEYVSGYRDSVMEIARILKSEANALSSVAKNANTILPD